LKVKAISRAISPDAVVLAAKIMASALLVQRLCQTVVHWWSGSAEAADVLPNCSAAAFGIVVFSETLQADRQREGERPFVRRRIFMNWSLGASRVMALSAKSLAKSAITHAWEPPG
jgi:hypothetical protein